MLKQKPYAILLSREGQISLKHRLKLRDDADRILLEHGHNLQVANGMLTFEHRSTHIVLSPSAWVALVHNPE